MTGHISPPHRTSEESRTEAREAQPCRCEETKGPQNSTSSGMARSGMHQKH